MKTKKKVIAIIRRRIEELKAGKQVGHWDVPHKPTEAERKGRVSLLEAIVLEIKAAD